VLDHPHLVHDGGTVQAEHVVFYLSAENHVERALAAGYVTAQTQAAKKPSESRKDSADASEIHFRSDQAEFLFVPNQDVVHTATMTGNVHVEQTGAQPLQADAGRAILDFAGQNQLQKVHAVDGARLFQEGARNVSTDNHSGDASQDFELTAPVIDFTVADGRDLRYAETSGAAKITITQAEQPKTAPQKTVVTAAKFDAHFAMLDGKNHLVRMHGEPDARIVNSAPGQPERTSTSDSVDATFLPQGGIDFVTQQGNVAYTDNQASDKRMQAWAGTARYTPSDQILLLTGNPRITNGPMATTATAIRINRATGDSFADTDVKSTYSDVKEQADGALLASSSPIHVTARSMTAHNSPGIAIYSGNARLWQDANVIEAPTIQFDRDHRSVVAQGTAAQPAQTIFVETAKDQTEKAGESSNSQSNASTQKSKSPTFSGTSPVAITAMRLTYTDAQRKVHYEGGVSAKGADFTATADTADAYLLARRETATAPASAIPSPALPASPGQLDHMVAQGGVVVQQPKRRAVGDKLVYTAADEKFVLTGGPPSIFDAEQGKITGVSLTFFRRDDRVLVEGEANTPVVTSTRVAQ